MHNTNQIAAPSGGARPMKVFVDNHGNEWLCDKDVDANGSFATQGCWRTDQMAFDRNF
jgi:streptogramin lyase